MRRETSRPFHHRLAAAALGLGLILVQGGWERSEAVVVLADRYGGYADCPAYADQADSAVVVARAYAALAPRPGLLSLQDFQEAVAGCRARRAAVVRAIFY